MKKIVLGSAVLAALLAVSLANADPLGKAASEMEISLPDFFVDLLTGRCGGEIHTPTDIFADYEDGAPPLAAHVDIIGGSSDAFLDVIENNDGTKTIIMRAMSEVSSTFVRPYISSLAGASPYPTFGGITVASELAIPYSVHYNVALETPGSVMNSQIGSLVYFDIKRTLTDGGSLEQVFWLEEVLWSFSSHAPVDEAVEGDWAGSFDLEPGYIYYLSVPARTAVYFEQFGGVPDAGGLTWAGALTWIGLLILARAKFAHR